MSPPKSPLDQTSSTPIILDSIQTTPQDTIYVSQNYHHSLANLSNNDKENLPSSHSHYNTNSTYIYMNSKSEEIQMTENSDQATLKNLKQNKDPHDLDNVGNFSVSVINLEDHINVHKNQETKTKHKSQTANRNNARTFNQTEEDYIDPFLKNSKFYRQINRFIESPRNYRSKTFKSDLKKTSSSDYLYKHRENQSNEYLDQLPSKEKNFIKRITSQPKFDKNYEYRHYKNGSSLKINRDLGKIQHYHQPIRTLSSTGLNEVSPKVSSGTVVYGKKGPEQ